MLCKRVDSVRVLRERNMGAGASMVIEEDASHAPTLHHNASPTDAIAFCRRYIGMLQGGNKHMNVKFHDAAAGAAFDGDDEASVITHADDDDIRTARTKSLGDFVPLSDLLETLQHLEASMIWLSASENRNKQSELQNAHRKERRAALQARLERRRTKGRSADVRSAPGSDGIEEIAIQQNSSDRSSLNVESFNRGSESKQVIDADTSSATISASFLIQQIQAVVVDSILWVTRLLEFGNSSIKAEQLDDGVGAFNEAMKLLEFVKNLSDLQNVSSNTLLEQKSGHADSAGALQHKVLPWDSFSEYIVELPLLLLLKSREIKRGVAAYFDVEALMHGMREGFGMMGLHSAIEEDNFSDVTGPGMMLVSEPPLYHKKMISNLIVDALQANSDGASIRVLDVGCGMGRFLGDCCKGHHEGSPIADLVEYVGVDSSKECIRMAKQRYSSGSKPRRGASQSSLSHVSRDFRREDIVSSCFDSASFDLIIVNEVLGFLPASETLLVLSKLRDWVSIHGRIFLSAPLISEKDEASTCTKSKTNFMVGLERSHPKIPGLFFRMFRRNELVNMASAVGLRVCSVEIEEPVGGTKSSGAGADEKTRMLPPRYVQPAGAADRASSAWGKQLQEQQEEQQEEPPASPKRSEFTPAYRCIMLTLEKKVT